MDAIEVESWIDFLSQEVPKDVVITRKGGGWVKKIRGLDKSNPTGFSLKGAFVNAPCKVFEGDILLDCSIVDRKKKRKYYNLFVIKDGKPKYVISVSHIPQWAVSLWKYIEELLENQTATDEVSVFKKKVIEQKKELEIHKLKEWWKFHRELQTTHPKKIAFAKKEVKTLKKVVTTPQNNKKEVEESRKKAPAITQVKQKDIKTMPFKGVTVEFLSLRTALYELSKKEDYIGFEAGVILYDKVTGEITEVNGQVFRPGLRILGGWCRIERKHKKPHYVSVRFEEFARPEKDYWLKMPSFMIRKTAIIQGVREVYPDIYPKVLESAAYR